MVRFLFGAALLGLASAHASAQPIRPADLREHIEMLASDAFEGRKPGTAGEIKTLAYISAQLAKRGFEPAGEGGSWYQPVPLADRRPFIHVSRWNGGEVDEVVLLGREPIERIAGPLVYAGQGLAGQIEGLALGGAVVLVDYEASAQPDAPGWAERSEALRAAGAAAIVAVMPAKVSWKALADSYAEGKVGLDGAPGAQISGAMSAAAAAKLIGRGTEPRRIGEARLQVSTHVHRFVSHNVLGRLRGTGGTGESVLYLGHWDHLGICRPEGAADRICNGAVDNASGIAMMIEIGERFARAPRPKRDIVIMATTAEEMGLLGARHFAARPTVPREKIVAAMNLDTVAIHGRGEKVAVIGRGLAPLDAAIDATAAALGRIMDDDKEADAFVQRQDGWELAKAGIPAVMVGGSFSNMAALGAFLGGPYHHHDDDLGRPLVLEGAAEDADFMVALGRRLADPALYRPR